MNNHFVFGVEGGRQRFEDDLLATGSRHHLIEGVFKAVVTLQLGHDRLAQSRRAERVGVVGFTRQHRRFGGLQDMGRGIEVGFTDGEVHDVATLRP